MSNEQDSAYANVCDNVVHLSGSNLLDIGNGLFKDVNLVVYYSSFAADGPLEAVSLSWPRYTRLHRSVQNPSPSSFRHRSHHR